MIWKSHFDIVINSLKLYQQYKADSYYFYLEEKIQYLDLECKSDIIIPCAVPLQGTYIGDLYILQTPGWDYIYKYLNKYNTISVLNYPTEVIYDYIESYLGFVNHVKDRYDYLELMLVSSILFPLYRKWLSISQSGQTIFNDSFYIIYEYKYYMNLLYNNMIKLINKIKISEYNDKIIKKYIIIQDKLPKYINIVQYLLLN